MHDILKQIRGGLVVSCQALSEEPLHDPDIMCRMAMSAASGGAVGIRANSVADIIAIRAKVHLPMIGIIKQLYENSDVYITPTMTEIDALVNTGVEIIAIDATSRPRPNGLTLKTLFAQARNRYPRQIFMADCATLEDAVNAECMGFDCIGTTLRGYTEQTHSISLPDMEFIRTLITGMHLPVIAEGGITTPEQLQNVLAYGAFCCVVGGAITRPREITSRFVAALPLNCTRIACGDRIIAIDIGGTYIKHCAYTVGEPLEQFQVNETPSNAQCGAELLIEQTVPAIIQTYLKFDYITICSCGWINPHEGRVLYSTEIVPGYTGIEIKRRLEARFHKPVMVENDAYAAAMGEAQYGAARELDRFLYLTYGTGIGGAIFQNGRLQYGHSFAAGGFGHMLTHAGGRACTCGHAGCYEAYASTKALTCEVEAVTGKQMTGFEIMGQMDDPQIAETVERWTKEVLYGLISLIHMYNPANVILGGGIMNNPRITEKIIKQLPTYLLPNYHSVKVLGSELGNRAGILGTIYLAMRNGMKLI